MKRAAWLSRHQPTPAQRDSLADYWITQVDPRGRCMSARDAWMMVCVTVGGCPDLVVIVLPRAMHEPFVRIAARWSPDTIILRAVMQPHQRDQWGGAWNRLHLYQHGVYYRRWTSLS